MRKRYQIDSSYLHDNALHHTNDPTHFYYPPAAGLFLYLYWWSIQRSNPQLDGTVTIKGFGAPVEILRDKHGIPHIYAQNRADLFRAQGFVHAQDRRWQMEQNRRIAQGRLAEVYGEAALDAATLAARLASGEPPRPRLESLDVERARCSTGTLKASMPMLRPAPAALAPSLICCVSNRHRGRRSTQ
ncbi:MAG: penicillin acylase family protein [Caldilineaceae bacterium]